MTMEQLVHRPERTTTGAIEAGPLVEQTLGVKPCLRWFEEKKDGTTSDREERATKGPRARVERSATEDRRGRSVGVERVMPARKGREREDAPPKKSSGIRQP